MGFLLLGLSRRRRRLLLRPPPSSSALLLRLFPSARVGLGGSLTSLTYSFTYHSHAHAPLTYSLTHHALAQHSLAPFTCTIHSLTHSPFTNSLTNHSLTDSRTIHSHAQTYQTYHSLRLRSIHSLTHAPFTHTYRRTKAQRLGTLDQSRTCVGGSLRVGRRDTALGGPGPGPSACACGARFGLHRRRLCWQVQHLGASDRSRAAVRVSLRVGRRETGVVCAGRRSSRTIHLLTHAPFTHTHKRTRRTIHLDHEPFPYAPFTF